MCTSRVPFGKEFRCARKNFTTPCKIAGSEGSHSVIDRQVRKGDIRVFGEAHVV
jgi:hypothetical protein